MAGRASSIASAISLRMPEMRPALFYRIAAILSLMFAAGHTIGFLAFRPSSAEGRAAMRAMARGFGENGARFSYAGFYQGFGLYCGLALVLTAVLAWWMGTLAKSSARATIFPAVALALFHFGGFALAMLYFPLPAAIFSALLMLLFGAGAAGAARLSRRTTLE